MMATRKDMKIGFGWNEDSTAISVDLSIPPDVLIDSEYLFCCSHEIDVPKNWVYLGTITDVRDGRSMDYFCSLTTEIPSGTTRLEVEPMDFYYDTLLPPSFRNHREKFSFTWYEIVKEAGTFSSSVRVKVQHFFRMGSVFDRELFVKALGELPLSISFADPDSVIVDMQFEFNEQSLLNTVVISYIASQIAGGTYHGWEVDVQEIAEMIQKNEVSD